MMFHLHLIMSKIYQERHQEQPKLERHLQQLKHFQLNQFQVLCWY